MAGNNITFGVNLSVDNYWDVPEFARRAEDMGYGRVTMGEHIMDGNPPRPTVLNLPAMAAAAGESTASTKMDVADDNEQEDADDEAAQLAAALAMSTNADTAGDAKADGEGKDAQFSDPSFVNQLLSDLPGVDLNDPQIQAAMAALGAGNKNGDKEDDKKDGTDSKK